MKILPFAAAALALTFIGACGGESRAPADTQAAAAPTPAPSASGEQTPDAGGKVIVVEAVTDEKGNYFAPADIEAHRGDVVRFTLRIGVHNVDFLADSNRSLTGYPTKPSDMLQLPGQTYDVKVTMPPGKYYFQCDPHAALGMHGRLEVEERFARSLKWTRSRSGSFEQVSSGSCWASRWVWRWPFIRHGWCTGRRTRT
jgi:plastocyanin